MGNHKKRALMHYVSVMGLALLLSACAGTGANTKTEPMDIESRAQARWDTFFAGDLNATYMFFSPAYRSSVSSLQYQKSVLTQRVQWTSAEITDSDCSENACKVRISLKYSLVAVLPGVPRFDGSQTVEENWIKSDGEWWFVPEK